MESNLNLQERHNQGMFIDIQAKVRDVGEKIIAKHRQVCSVILRGAGDSTPRILLVVDDLNNYVIGGFVDEVKYSMTEICFASSLHIEIDSVLASRVWDGILERSPDYLAIFRDSFAVIDNGFFVPLQDSILKGRVRPTEEAVVAYFIKSQKSFKASEDRLSRAILDLYWAVIDSAHAAVMVMGFTPPSPGDLADMFRKELVSRKLVNPRCADIIEQFYTVAKQIMHKERFNFSGHEFDAYLAEADFFTKEIESFCRRHLR